MAQELGMKIGITRYANLPDYSSESASVPTEAINRDDVKSALLYSVFFQTKAYRDFGARISVAYSVLDRGIGIENIFSLRENFEIIPIELLLYRNFQIWKVHLRPFAGIGFARGEFALSNVNHVSKMEERWEYSGSTIGFPIGFGIGFDAWKHLRLGAEAWFRYYRIDNFGSDYECSEGTSNAFVFLDSGILGPSCLESGGEPHKKGFIDYSSLNLSFVMGFGW